MQTAIIYEDNLKREAGYNLWMDEKIERKRDELVPFGYRTAFDKSVALHARRLAAANGGTIRDYMRLVGNIRLRSKNVVDLPAQSRYDQVVYLNM
jgi:hypothetical protein